jgi:signal transduction histidine kinase
MDGTSDGLNLPPRSARAASVLVAAFIAAIDLSVPDQYNLSIAYCVPVAIAAWSRRPTFLWSMVVAVAIATYLDIFIGRSSGFRNPAAVQFNRSLVVLATMLMGALVHWWIRLQQETERVRDELSSANRDLALRKEQVARQNEELAQREQTLRSLLQLSRSLTVELTPGETMNRICQTLAHLVQGSATATAILLREGDDMVVRCHHGFGEQGLREERFAAHTSFAEHVFSQGRSGYLEDVALRPGMNVPQPKAGDPIVSVLAVPLMVGGGPIGTLELYSRQRRSWSDEQIALAESLGAQTAISLENAKLFQDIQRERTRLGTVLRLVPFAIVICNDNCTEIRANPAGAALLNVPQDHPMSPVEAFSQVQVFRDGRELTMQEHPLLLAASTGSEIHGEELEWLLPGQRRVHVLVSAVPIRQHDGAISGAISVKADVTQLKTLQRELDLRRREAEEASVRKSRFLAAASHDIRTPANAISLIAELIKRTSDTPGGREEVPQLAEELQRSAASLVNLVSNVLDVTRFESGAQDLFESEFPLAALLDEEVRQTLPLAQAKNIGYHVEQPEEPLQLRTDRVKLGRVLGNLLGNAIKFTDRGHVRIVARRLAGEAGGIEIAVSDTGVGIAPENHDRIFDEFFQISDPQRSKGSGLGLAISKRLIEAMGGTLSVQSERGQGSTFTITLPGTTIVSSAEAPASPSSSNAGSAI